MADKYSQTIQESNGGFECESGAEHGPEQIYGKLIKLATMASTTNIGQYLLDKADKVLYIVETTAKWSVPRKFLYLFSNKLLIT